MKTLDAYKIVAHDIVLCAMSNTIDRINEYPLDSEFAINPSWEYADLTKMMTELANIDTIVSEVLRGCSYADFIQKWMHKARGE